MTRRRGELPEPEEELLGIERLTPEQEAEAEREQAQREEVRVAFLRQLLAGSEFRAWLMAELTKVGTFANAFGGTGEFSFPDPYATWFAAGRKSAGWDIWEQFDDAAPDLASLMRREARPKPPPRDG